MEIFICDKLKTATKDTLNHQITDQKLLLTDQINKIPDHSKITKQLAIQHISLNEYLINKLIFNDDFKGNIMNTLCELEFIPCEVISWIENKCDKCHTIKFDNVTIHILKNNNDGKNGKLYDIINNVVSIIKWMIAISLKNKPTINIYIYMSDFKKEINMTNPFLGYMEFNSGLSYKISETKGCIHIYRQEELYKVLIHELLHNLEIDINKYETIETQMHVHSSSHKILFNEAYTEVIANYLHCIFYAYKHDFSLKQILKEEYEFTHIQINKIFRAFKITGINYFKNPNKFKQYTNVIPYFIIKYFLMNYIQELLLRFNNKYETIVFLKQIITHIYNKEMCDSSLIITDNSMKMIKYDFL